MFSNLLCETRLSNIDVRIYSTCASFSSFVVVVVVVVVVRSFVRSFVCLFYPGFLSC